MSDIFEDLANVIGAIKSDPKLRTAFVQALQFGASTQQVRASALLDRLVKMGAPDEVKNFVRLLGNEKLANKIRVALESD